MYLTFCIIYMHVCALMVYCNNKSWTETHNLVIHLVRAHASLREVCVFKPCIKQNKNCCVYPGFIRVVGFPKVGGLILVIGQSGEI